MAFKDIVYGLLLVIGYLWYFWLGLLMTTFVIAFLENVRIFPGKGRLNWAFLTKTYVMLITLFIIVVFFTPQLMGLLMLPGLP